VKVKLRNDQPDLEKEERGERHRQFRHSVPNNGPVPNPHFRTSRLRGALKKTRQFSTSSWFLIPRTRQFHKRGHWPSGAKLHCNPHLVGKCGQSRPGRAHECLATHSWAWKNGVHRPVWGRTFAETQAGRQGKLARLVKGPHCKVAIGGSWAPVFGISAIFSGLPMRLPMD
jgi:hypothetical protein